MRIRPTGPSRQRVPRPDIVVVTDHGQGKGAAVRQGVEAASGDDIVMLDADGSMDPAEIDRFLCRLREGHDLVKGSRFLPGGGTSDMTLLRQTGNLGLLLLSNILYRTSHTDLCYGYAAFRRSAFLDLGLTGDGFEIEAELFMRAQRAGLRVAEVASFEAPRRAGFSNLNTFRDGWRVLMTIIRERRRKHPGRARGNAPRPMATPFPTRPRLVRAGMNGRTERPIPARGSTHAVARSGDVYPDP